MLTSHDLKIFESCLSCAFRTEGSFCGLSIPALQHFERLKASHIYPKYKVLFLEGQVASGIFVLCKGRVKLSLSAVDGKTFILNVAQPGELLGLSSAISGSPYEFSVTTCEVCEVSFVKRGDFLRFLKENPEACFRITQQLGLNYYNACHEIRSLGLSQSTGEKLARLLWEWSVRDGKSDQRGIRVTLSVTQDEIAQMIGCCRETVTRLFADLKRRRIGECRVSTLVIHDMTALRALADNRSDPLRPCRTTPQKG
jgi:CRP/FNR family transcriptional regulator